MDDKSWRGRDLIWESDRDIELDVTISFFPPSLPDHALVRVDRREGRRARVLRPPLLASTFSGQRALDFVLQNQQLIDKTLLFHVKLVRVDAR